VAAWKNIALFVKVSLSELERTAGNTNIAFVNAANRDFGDT